MTQMTQVRVIVADDHPLFRQGMRRILVDQGFDVVGEAKNGVVALELACRLRPDVVVMDLNMPAMCGAEATRLLAERAPEVRVLVLTVLAEREEVASAISAGAVGYLLKDATVDQIATGVAAAARGESPVSPRIAPALLDCLRSSDWGRPRQEETPLSDREQQVLSLVAGGLDNVEIAGRLYLSQSTVKNHVSSILGKLGVENRTQAAVRAVRQGLLTF
jgi:DNA-binding NarL/FixJ family response regulator